MPKFSDKERELIKNKIYIEGEMLFANMGVKKVTVNDIANAVGISHGSYYNFFESKEHLFMDINFQKQKEIFAEVDDLIKDNFSATSENMVKLVLLFLIERFFTDKIISQINGEIMEYLIRKTPSYCLDVNVQRDKEIVEKLIDAGVKFKESSDLIVKLFQATFVTLSSLINDTDFESIKEIILNGLINEIIM